MNCSYEQSEPQKPLHITFPIQRAIKESERVGEREKMKGKERASKEERRERKEEEKWMGWIRQ